MLTRIISGLTMVAIVLAVLFTHSYTPWVTVLFISALTAVAVKEILYNTGIIKNKIIVSGAIVFATAANILYFYMPTLVVPLTVAYVVFIVVGAVIWAEEFTPTCVASAIAFPSVLAYAFSCIYAIYGGYGFVYLFLIANCSAICDAGAYFVGVTLGKHKLCPKISPKKTVEGAVGGIIVSEIVTVVTVFVANIRTELVPLMMITFILCIVGMIGDLFASVIKRAVGIKDYGKLIPGHGGILDRFDSILLIAPVFAHLLRLVEVIRV